MLVAAISVSLASAASAAIAESSETSTGGTHQPHAPQIWVVQNCSDGADGSLRDLIENPNNAQSGDTIDLAQLQGLCGVANSTITLTSGEIKVHQNELTLVGPDAANASVTISGGGHSRIFSHLGSGILSINRLTIRDGHFHAVGDASGGCIDASVGGNGIYLYESKVTACTVESDAGTARGGAIRAANVGLVLSEVSGSLAETAAGHAYGGGIHANNFLASYGTLSNNEARQGPSSAGSGGGVYASAGVTVFNSTIDHNHASYGGGFVTRGASMLVNSTVSDNVAEQVAGAWYARGGTLSIWNSTVSFNKTTDDSNYAAVTFHGADATSPLDLRSSIIANNKVGVANVENDLTIVSGFGTLTGQDSLVMASTPSDPGIIVSVADPKLGGLRFNGGPTKTRLLQPDSPARGIGNEVGNPHDQRGRGYPRSSGGVTDIGAVQFDEIFPGAFE